jgi:hypothetical protein
MRVPTEDVRIPEGKLASLETLARKDAPRVVERKTVADESVASIGDCLGV